MNKQFALYMQKGSDTVSENHQSRKPSTYEKVLNWIILLFYISVNKIMKKEVRHMKKATITNAWYHKLACWGCLGCAACPGVGLLAGLSGVSVA